MEPLYNNFSKLTTYTDYLSNTPTPNPCLIPRAFAKYSVFFNNNQNSSLPLPIEIINYIFKINFELETRHLKIIAVVLDKGIALSHMNEMQKMMNELAQLSERPSSLENQVQQHIRQQLEAEYRRPRNS